MNIYDIIYKKRLGNALSKEEIDFFISEYARGGVADYQASALLMAICIQGMNKDETFYLTDAMMRSGDIIDLSPLGDFTVDKHSTGGVGDKTTLIVAPIVASLGCKVAKMSGRGLGHTGGTVDKLESISGYRSSLSSQDFLSQVERVGIAVTGQSGNLAPADKKLYALRDVTATVDSIPLIASSIMSKKLASGAKSIVLDVKCGNGAFMKDKESALALGRAMIDIGNAFSRNVRVLVTNMDMPLGFYVGNSLEVYEAISVLSGKSRGALYEICVALASNMVSLALDISIDAAKERVLDSILSGKALSKMKEWIRAQGGDASLIEHPEGLICAPYSMDIKAPSCGYISKIFAKVVGEASMALGAGRAKKDDVIDLLAGIKLNVTVGDYVSCGDTLCTLYSSNKESFLTAASMLEGAFELSPSEPEKSDLIYFEI
jgi:pyrimidine-nucleoside phosphorylase